MKETENRSVDVRLTVECLCDSQHCEGSIRSLLTNVLHEVQFRSEISVTNELQNNNRLSLHDNRETLLVEEIRSLTGWCRRRRDRTMWCCSYCAIRVYFYSLVHDRVRLYINGVTSRTNLWQEQWIEWEKDDSDKMISKWDHRGPKQEVNELTRWERWSRVQPVTSV